MSRLKPDELLEEIRDQERADRVAKEAAGKTEEQAKASLEAKGVDLEAESAKFDAMVEKFSPHDADVVPIGPARRGPWAGGRIIALVGIAAALLLFVKLSPVRVEWGPPPIAGTAAAGTEPQEAHDLRFMAYRAYAQGKWQESLDLFDRAKAIDASGDEDPAIVTARNSAKRALAADGG